MKSLTREEWLKNPLPRDMWVWNELSGKDRQILKVIYFTEETFPIVTVKSDETHVEKFRFCAELEKSRRMTYKELSWWLTEKPHREYKYSDKSFIYNKFYYSESQQDESVPVKILIRENGGAWQQPLIEVYL